jgi:hypothetical protein
VAKEINPAERMCEELDCIELPYNNVQRRALINKAIKSFYLIE